VGLAMYDQTAEISLKGLVNGFTGLIASALTLVNTIPAHMSDIAGLNVIKSIRRSLAQEDFDKIEITSGLYPLIATS